MKVIQYIGNLRSGGKERQLVELLKGLSCFDDIECELITMSNEIHYLEHFWEKESCLRSIQKLQE